MGLRDEYGCDVETIEDPTPGEWYDEEEDH